MRLFECDLCGKQAEAVEDADYAKEWDVATIAGQRKDLCPDCTNSVFAFFGIGTVTPSRQMKYRALLIDPKAKQADRAQQSLSNSLPDLEKWAAATLATVAAGHSEPTELEVVIYQTSEKPVRSIKQNLAGSVSIHELERANA